MRVLVLENNPHEARALVKALEAESFVVDVPSLTNDSVEREIASQYDLVVLGLASWNVGWLQKLRTRGNVTPILALDYSGSAEARCRAIAMGADDCLTKPYLLGELLVRVRALLRRPHTLIDKLKVADLVLDRVGRMAIRNGRFIRLTPKEFAVLEYLMRNAGRPVSRSLILEHVWKGHFEGLTNVVDVYINALRSKIDRGFDVRLIRTAYGIGYMISDHATKDDKEAVA